MHNVYLGTTKPAPLQQYYETIAHNMVKGLLRALQFYNLYKTFKT